MKYVNYDIHFILFFPILGLHPVMLKVLNPGIMPGRLTGSYGVPEIKPWSTVCKASSMSDLLPLQLLKKFLTQKLP